MNKIKLFGIALLAAIALMGNLQASEQNKQLNMTLWQTMDALQQQIPLSKQGVEAALSTQLFEVDEPSNHLFHFFESPPMALTEGVVISGLDLRLKRGGGHPGFLALAIGGACVTLDQIRAHYEPLKLTDAPHGHSLNEEFVYSQSRPWGELSFGFAERNPKCLSSIALRPK